MGGNLHGYFHHNLKENCIMVLATKHMKQMPREGIPEKFMNTYWKGKYVEFEVIISF